MSMSSRTAVIQAIGEVIDARIKFLCYTGTDRQEEDYATEVDAAEQQLNEALHTFEQGIKDGN